jgi:hypothetical protein
MTSQDTALLQAAFDGGGLVDLEPGRVYEIDQPLRIDRRVKIRGGFNAKIKAVGPVDQLLTISVSGIAIEDVAFDGAWNAGDGVVMEGCSTSIFTRCVFQRAIRDGVHHPSHDPDGNYLINDRNTYLDCTWTQNGRVYRTPGFGTYIGRHVVTQQVHDLSDVSFTLSADRKTLGVFGWDPSFLRRGDPIRIATEEHDVYRMIEEVGPNTITLHKPMPEQHPIIGVAIGHGDGHYEKRHGDNNIHLFLGGLARTNAGFQFAFAGLYGPKMLGVQLDTCPFWPIRVGERSSGPVLGSIFDGLYFEADAGAGANFLLVAAQNFTIRNGVERGGGNAGQYELAYTYGVRGAIVGNEGISSIGDTGFKIRAEATSLAYANVRGAVNWGAKQMFVGNPGNPHAFDPAEPVDTGVGSVVWISTPVQGLTLAGTPALTCVAGRMVWLVNRGPGELTLQDRSTRGGSALWLSGQRDRVLPRWSGIALACDGFRWVEVGSAPIGGGE